MAALTWHDPGTKEFETGVDHGVLYIPDEDGLYNQAYPWNGLISVNEAPSGAEANKQYADNGIYLNLLSAEEFGATVEAYTYPDAFAECDGTAVPAKGVYVGQQMRKPFALSYRTKIGNEVAGANAGYKIHIIYNALAKPTSKQYSSINASPEASTFSWELSTTPVEFGSSYDDLLPTAIITINSLEADPVKLKAVENALYGFDTALPSLPAPNLLVDMLVVAGG